MSVRHQYGVWILLLASCSCASTYLNLRTDASERFQHAPLLRMQYALMNICFILFLLLNRASVAHATAPVSSLPHLRQVLFGYVLAESD